MDSPLGRMTLRSAVSIVMAAAVVTAAEPDTGRERLLNDAVLAERPKQAHSAYRALFRNVPLAEVEAFKESRHGSVAIFAAWECAIQQASHDAAKARDDKDKSQRALRERAAFARLCGFIEGRLQVELPAWWEDSLRLIFHETCIGEAVVENDELNSGPEEFDPYWFRRVDGAKLGDKERFNSILARGLDAERHGEQVLLRYQGIAIPFEGDEVEAVLAANVLSCVRQGNNLFLSVASDGIVSEWDLYCFDTERSSLKWKSQGWGYFSLEAGTTGWAENRTTLSVNESSVILFGVGTGGAYLEAFDRADGKAQCHFCSSYWMRAGIRGSILIDAD